MVMQLDIPGAEAFSANPFQPNRYLDSVERWRDEVRKQAPASIRQRPDFEQLVDKYMFTMQGESGGGNQSALEPGSDGATGLMRIQNLAGRPSPDQLMDPVTNIKYAWGLIAQNPEQWKDYGEGALYDRGDGKGPQPFGALGRMPYPGDQGKTYGNASSGGNAGGPDGNQGSAGTVSAGAPAGTLVGDIFARANQGDTVSGQSTGDVPVAAGQAQADLQARLEAVRDTVGGGIAGQVKDFATSDLPGAGTVKNAVQTVADTNIPGTAGLVKASDLSPFAGVSLLSRGANAVKGLAGLAGVDTPSGGEVLAGQVPTTPLDIGLSVPPGEILKAFPMAARLLRSEPELLGIVSRGAGDAKGFEASARAIEQAMQDVLSRGGSQAEARAAAKTAMQEAQHAETFAESLKNPTEATLRKASTSTNPATQAWYREYTANQRVTTTASDLSSRMDAGANVVQNAGRTITGEAAPSNVDEIATALTREADRLDAMNLPEAKNIAADVASAAKRLGDPANAIRTRMQDGGGQPDTVNAATNQRGNTFTDAANAERQAAITEERAAVQAHQTTVEAADLARRRDEWLATQAAESTAREAASAAAKPGAARQAANEFGATLAAPVSLKSNLSPPLMRQGLARVVTSPVQAIKEFGTSLKALREAPAETIHAFYADDIMVKRSDALTPEAVRGFSFQDVGGTVLDWRSKDLNIKPEDMAGFMPDTRVGRFTEKVTQMFNRQAAVEINLHRTGWYKEVASEMLKSGDRDVTHYEELRKTVEQFTQRGSWAQPKVSVAGIDLPTFFSTRALSGRLQSAWRGMAAVVQHPGGLLPGAAPSAEREAARAFVGLVGVNVAMLGGMYAATDTMGLKPSIEMDGKLPTLKVGAERWDPWAGMNAPAKFAIGVISDTVDAAKNNGIENAPQGALESLNNRGQKFLRGGFAPVLGKAADTATGHDFTGQKYNLWKDVVSGGFAKDMTAPFVAENIIDAATQDSPAAGAAAAGPAFLSTGINTYTTNTDHMENTAQDLFGKPFAQLSVPEKLKALENVPPEAQRQATQVVRQDYTSAKTQAGYDSPSANTGALDRKNPQIDVQGWGLDGGHLQSIEAVNLALQAGTSKDVLFGPADGGQGFKRAINQDENSKKAWEYSRKPLDWYLNEVVPQNAQKFIDEYAKGKDGAVWKKGDGSSYTFDQLPPDLKTKVTSEIHKQASTPEIEAWLAWWGERDVPKNDKPVEAALKKITDTYGSREYSSLKKGVLAGVKEAGR